MTQLPSLHLQWCVGFAWKPGAVLCLAGSQIAVLPLLGIHLYFRTGCCSSRCCKEHCVAPLCLSNAAQDVTLLFSTTPSLFLAVATLVTGWDSRWPLAFSLRRGILFFGSVEKVTFPVCMDGLCFHLLPRML